MGTVARIGFLFLLLCVKIKIIVIKILERVCHNSFLALAKILKLNKIKIISIFGTRPEAIKMAPLVKILEKSKYIESLVCVTAQHREMLDQVLSIFDIKPNYDLNIMEPNQTLEKITTKALNGLSEVIKKEKPDLILVHGDTTTTFSGALAGFYNKVKVGHIEAGLRTNSKYEPFPEEINRVLTSRLTDFHFAPTDFSKQNLLKENIKDSIYVTGNTVIDALSTTLNNSYTFFEEKLNKIDYSKKIISVTAHRRENIGENLVSICNAIKRLVNDFSDVEVVYAVHKNPAVRNVVDNILGKSQRVHLLNPLNLTDMHNLMNKSYFVMTDSGGLQEEVPSMGKPVLVLRNVTERPEGIHAGTLKLVGTNEKFIYENASNLLLDKSLYKSMAKAKNPFGDGKASERILNAILFEFGILKQKQTEFLGGIL